MKCKHKRHVDVYRGDCDENEDGIVVRSHCAQIGCNATLSLGPSNDEPSNVHEEIEAARVERLFTVPLQYEGGYFAHLNDRDPPEPVGISWRAGWLAREMYTHDMRDSRDSDALPWDPTEPIAEQWPWNGRARDEAVAAPADSTSVDDRFDHGGEP